MTKEVTGLFFVLITMRIRCCSKKLDAAATTSPANNNNNNITFDLYCNKTIMRIVIIMSYTISTVNDTFIKRPISLFNILRSILNGFNMMSFQAMDNLQLLQSGFEALYAIQFCSLNILFKSVTSRGSLSIQAQDNGDIINFIFESSDNNRYLILN